MIIENTEWKKTRCPFCQSTNIAFLDNVGSDIDASGEETQHIDKCECGAWRFNIDRYDNFSDYRKIFGKWHEDDKDGFLATVGY